MEYSSKASNADVIKTESRDLAQKLFSRDPILFNSALNAYFDSQATYHGHALNIKGVSQIKHAAWLWSVVNLGRGSTVSSKDVQWDHKALTLTVRATRHIRPIVLPLFTFAVPVKSVIKFQPTKDDDNIVHLYAVHWDDQWPLGYSLEHIPIVGFFLSTFLTPIATYFFLAISNFLFALNAKVSTLSRHWTSPQAQQQYSRSVPASVRHGFEEGEKIAQGWGHWLLGGATRATYHPLQVVEWTAQTAASVVSPFLPFKLPAVAVFDPKIRAQARSVAHGAPLSEPIPLRTQKTLAAEETHAKRTVEEDKSNPRGDAQHAATAPYELPAAMPGQGKDIKRATVEVGPSDTDKGQTIDIASHQFNEAKPNPSHGSQPARPDSAAAGGESVFDKVDTATIKKAEEAGQKAKAALKSSEEDGHKHKQKKAKHSSDSSGQSTPEKSSGKKSSSKSSSSGNGTHSKKRKDQGH